MRVATVWGWGDEFEDVKGNCRKYISKRWDESIKECCIEVIAKDSEGACYFLSAYINNPRSVGEFAEGLFYVALYAGYKVERITIQLSDSIISDEEKYRDSIENAEIKLEEYEQAIRERFTNDPRVNSIVQERKIEFISPTNLLCELESEIANKIVTEVIHEDFSHVKDLSVSLNNRLIEEGLAKRVTGYKIWKSVDEFEIYDMNIRDDEAYIWLGVSSK